jgi:hypothetical protein
VIKPSIIRKKMEKIITKFLILYQKDKRFSREEAGWAWGKAA